MKHPTMPRSAPPAKDYPPQLSTVPMKDETTIFLKASVHLGLSRVRIAVRTLTLRCFSILRTQKRKIKL